MKTTLLAIAFLSVSLLTQCNNSKPKYIPKIYSVNMVSETLNVNKTSAEEGKDYEAAISFKQPDIDYRLPNLISISIGETKLAEEDYQYNASNGAVFIPKNKIDNDISITAEKVHLEGYRANFICDEHVKVSFYKTRNYSKTSEYLDFAYARDKDSGLIVKDGKGEVNFKVDIDENYDIDTIWVKGLYDNCNDQEKTKKDDVYRITKIRSDLEVNITTKKIYCKNFMAFDDLVKNEFNFAWSTRKPENVDHFNIDVTSVDYTKHFEVQENSFIFKEATVDQPYDFTFTPILKNNVHGDSLSQNCMLTVEPKNAKFSRIEINTQNNVLPVFKPICEPFLTTGISDYVQSNISIYKADGTKTYTTTSDFKGSKIKYRGNSSAYHFIKKPYKIKLEEPADLLSSFRKYKKADVNYANKNWVLLATTQERKGWLLTTNILKSTVGFTIANSLEFDFIQEFEYVSLYLNGDYRGIYILCEGVEKGNGSGEKQSRCKIDNSGFIVENDLFWPSEDLYFDTPITSGDLCKYTFKYPDTDDISAESEQYKYIKNYITLFEEKLIAQDEECFNYFDINSLAKWLLTHDILASYDDIGTNMFVCKKDNSENTKLYMGPPWDFDSSEAKIETFSAVRNLECFYYPKLLKFDTFNDKIKNLFNNYATVVISNINNYLNLLLSNKGVFDSLLQVEATRWNCEYVSLETQAGSTAEFYTKHLAWLEAHI